MFRPLTDIGMKHGYSILALCGMYMGFIAAAPQWSSNVGLDFWNTSQLESNYRSALQLNRELEDEAEDGVRRSQAIERVIVELIDGNVSLHDAVERLEVINRDRRGFTTGLQLQYREQNLREAYVKLTFSQIEQYLAHEPERCEQVLTRLTSAYQNMPSVDMDCRE